MITQLIHLTWFLGSELVADLKAKTKSSTPCGSPGTGLPTPALDHWGRNTLVKVSTLQLIDGSYKAGNCSRKLLQEINPISIPAPSPLVTPTFNPRSAGVASQCSVRMPLPAYNNSTKILCFKEKIMICKSWKFTQAPGPLSWPMHWQGFQHTMHWYKFFW